MFTGEIVNKADEYIMDQILSLHKGVLDASLVILNRFHIFICISYIQLWVWIIIFVISIKFCSINQEK